MLWMHLHVYYKLYCIEKPFKKHEPKFIIDTQCTYTMGHLYMLLPYILRPLPESPCILFTYVHVPFREESFCSTGVVVVVELGTLWSGAGVTDVCGRVEGTSSFDTGRAWGLKALWAIGALAFSDICAWMVEEFQKEQFLSYTVVTTNKHLIKCRTSVVTSKLTHVQLVHVARGHQVEY